MDEEHMGWAECPYCREAQNKDCTLCDGRGEIQVVFVTGSTLLRDLGWFLFRFAVASLPFVLVLLFGFLLGRL